MVIHCMSVLFAVDIVGITNSSTALPDIIQERIHQLLWLADVRQPRKQMSLG